jgi:hypothetical protein
MRHHLIRWADVDRYEQAAAEGHLLYEDQARKGSPTDIKSTANYVQLLNNLLADF